MLEDLPDVQKAKRRLGPVDRDGGKVRKKPLKLPRFLALRLWQKMGNFSELHEANMMRAKLLSAGWTKKYNTMVAEDILHFVYKKKKKRFQTD